MVRDMMILANECTWDLGPILELRAGVPGSEGTIPGVWAVRELMFVFINMFIHPRGHLSMYGFLPFEYVWFSLGVF